MSHFTKLEGTCSPSA